MFHAVGALLLIGMAGCRVLNPIEIPVATQQIAPELLDDETEQVEIGRPHKILDTAGWIVGIPDKILLWDRRVNRHAISEPTLDATADYLTANNLPHVKVRANQYAPLKDFGRLRKNKTVAWPYRYTLGVLSVAGEAIVPGRLFGGDHFNPFTQTVHLYSDVPSIALHELAHAKDFTRRTYQGTYALAYSVLPIWHETLASQDVFAHLYERGDREGVVEANRILYPAYATYIGNGIGNWVPNYALPVYYGSVIAGHANGRMLSRHVDHQLAVFQAKAPGSIQQVGYQEEITEKVAATP